MPMRRSSGNPAAARRPPSGCGLRHGRLQLLAVDPQRLGLRPPLDHHAGLRVRRGVRGADGVLRVIGRRRLPVGLRHRPRRTGCGSPMPSSSSSTQFFRPDLRPTGTPERPEAAPTERRRARPGRRGLAAWWQAPSVPGRVGVRHSERLGSRRIGVAVLRGHVRLATRPGSTADRRRHQAPHLDDAGSVRISPGRAMTILGGGFGRRGAGGACRAGKVGPAGTGQGGSVPYVTERDFEASSSGASFRSSSSSRPTGASPARPSRPRSRPSRARSQGKAKVVKIDIDKSPVIAQQLRIQSVPTFMVVAEGRIQDGVVGAIRKKKMHELVEPFLPRSAGALKPAELAQLLAGGAVSPVDTRDAGAFGRAHLPGAVNMPIEEIETRLAELHMLQGAARPLLPLGRQDEGAHRAPGRAGAAGGVPRGRPSRVGSRGPADSTSRIGESRGGAMGQSVGVRHERGRTGGAFPGFRAYLQP